MQQDLTLRQLRCRAKERGIVGYSRMDKDQLVALLAEVEEDFTPILPIEN